MKNLFQKTLFVVGFVVMQSLVCFSGAEKPAFSTDVFNRELIHSFFDHRNVDELIASVAQGYPCGDLCDKVAVISEFVKKVANLGVLMRECNDIVHGEKDMYSVPSYHQRLYGLDYTFMVPSAGGVEQDLKRLVALLDMVEQRLREINIQDVRFAKKQYDRFVPVVAQELIEKRSKLTNLLISIQEKAGEAKNARKAIPGELFV
jgi:hypothetical protein